MAAAPCGGGSGGGATAVLPGLLLAGFEESFDRRALAAHGVTHVLNVAAECEVSQRVGLAYQKHGLPDDDPAADIRAVLGPCMAFLRAAHDGGGCALVHCLEGVSRSACVVACYMVAHLGWAWPRAWARLRRLRPAVDPFPLYLAQTAAWLAATAAARAGPSDLSRGPTD